MNIFSLDIYNGRYDHFLSILKTVSEPILVFTPNPEILVKAHHDDEYYLLLKKADYLTPDANGLYTASLMQEGKSFFMALLLTFFRKKSLREKYGELIQGSNLTKDLVDFATREKKKILMIDNYKIITPENPFEEKKMEIQKKLPLLFKERFPELLIEIVFDGEKVPGEVAHIIQNENISYVFSCIGMKTQEKRLVEIFSYLPDNFPVVGLGVGSSFDYLLGLQKRAPQVFQMLGLEWLYRLLLHPLTRGRRIKTALFDFPKLIQPK